MATKIAAPKKTSRLLAALDNPESLFDDDPDIIQLTGQKRGLDASEHDGRGSNKRRVKGLGIRQASPAVAGMSFSAGRDNRRRIDLALLFGI